jgi:hypothetical protein
MAETNRNYVINKNRHKNSLFCDGINQNIPSFVNYLKQIIFNVVLNTLSVFIKTIVAALRMSRYKGCIWNLCVTGFLFLDGVSLLLTHRYNCYSATEFVHYRFLIFGWGQPAADTLL